MTKQIWVVSIEPIDTRYTREWYDHIPKLIDNTAKFKGEEVDVIVVNGDQVTPVTTPGAFLDFGATNIWKSSQLMNIAEEFRKGNVKSGDKFLYTDAWNPTVIQVKYMSELLNIPVEIHGMWHAGSYDSHDFLGRLIGDKPWIKNAEQSMFNCYDTNWFATNFHLNMFLKGMYPEYAAAYDENLNNSMALPIKSSADKIKSNLVDTKKVNLTGWPMEYLFSILEPYKNLAKKQQIVFPHRLAPEKQLEIFKDLETSMPQYTWIVCQEKTLTKHEYHTILGESSIVFSASLQETLGLSIIEGLICNTTPFIPDRLSYTEMYNTDFKYPSEWTANWESYLTHKDLLMERITSIINARSQTPIILNSLLTRQLENITDYINASALLGALLT